ncbi:hypothetical protein [Clostridium tyrobutyricum]|uniref:hypothetical protein n=1 Tax=Clostridium tyrobutyricum TaxID=1519 RepID=UPI0020CB3A9A|nr:hypothetical protein [Clostridium tyrobutyricum]
MIKSFLKIEFKRTFFSWKTLIAFILFMAVYIHISYLDGLDLPKLPPSTYYYKLMMEDNNFFMAYLKVMAGGANSYMSMVFPIIILLTVGDSLIQDMKTGFLEFYLTRIDCKKYIFAKNVSVGIVGFIVALIFQICGFIYTVCTHPFYLPKDLDKAPLFLRGMYMQVPYLYILMTMIIFSFIAAAVVLFGMLLSNKLKNSVQAILLPYVIYLILGLGIYNGIPVPSIYAFSPVMMCGTFIFTPYYSLGVIAVYWIGILLICGYFSCRLFLKKFKVKSDLKI